MNAQIRMHTTAVSPEPSLLDFTTEKLHVGLSQNLGF